MTSASLPKSLQNLALACAILLAPGAVHASALTDSIPYPFHAVQEGGQNQVLFIDDSITAFAERIAMIRRAKQSIAIEYFIYNTDAAGQVFTQELVAAAKRGVKVRVLVDKSIAVFKLNEYYAKEMAAHGIEVRYYNAAPIYDISSEQFRTHRKLTEIDDVEAITGGRNIADEYFDLSTTFNFNDSDMYVHGPMAKVMREAFDLFFANPITERPTFPVEPKFFEVSRYNENTALAKAFLQDSPQSLAARQRIAREGDTQLSQMQPVVCPTLTFATDAPGADFSERIKPGFVDHYRFLRKVLFEKISAANEHLIISSPYVIDGANNELTLDNVLKSGAKIDVYTNSLGSTDATYVAANMYLKLKDWRAEGLQVHLNDGEWIPTNPNTPDFIRQVRGGTHSKVQVYISKNNSEVMVGTYNVDHRSNYYNAEMALFCAGSPELTNTIVKSIERNMAYGLTVNGDASSTTDRFGKMRSVYGASDEQIWKMRLITLPSRVARELM